MLTPRLRLSLFYVLLIHHGNVESNPNKVQAQLLFITWISTAVLSPPWMALSHQHPQKHGHSVSRETQAVAGRIHRIPLLAVLALAALECKNTRPVDTVAVAVHFPAASNVSAVFEPATVGPIIDS